MIPVVIDGHTRALGAPQGWTPETSGECGVLAIRDGMNGDMPSMESAWEPTPDELATLNAGGKVVLRVLGQGHPPVWVGVAEAGAVSAGRALLEHQIGQLLGRDPVCFGRVTSGTVAALAELLLSGGYPVERVAKLIDYVWGRPAGEPAQEVGGVMVTLAAYCLAFGLDMHTAASTELARIWTKVELIRAKQARKAAALGSTSPLPVPPRANDSASEER